MKSVMSVWYQIDVVFFRISSRRFEGPKKTHCMCMLLKVCIKEAKFMVEQIYIKWVKIYLTI